MSSVIPNKNTALAANQKALQGVDKHFAKVKTLTLAGVRYTPASLKGLLQGEIDASHALDQSRAQTRAQVAATRVARAKALAARKGLRAYVLGIYGAHAVQVLEDFGISPPKPPGPPTAKAKAEAVVKAQATRKARHTMGKKQKKSIKGAPQAKAPAQVETPAQAAAPGATTPKS